MTCSTVTMILCGLKFQLNRLWNTKVMAIFEIYTIIFGLHSDNLWKNVLGHLTTICINVMPIWTIFQILNFSEIWIRSLNPSSNDIPPRPPTPRCWEGQQRNWRHDHPQHWIGEMGDHFNWWLFKVSQQFFQRLSESFDEQLMKLYV